MTINELAALSYNAYWIIALAALWAVFSYVRDHREEISQALFVLSIGAMLNFSGDAASKVWYWTWRLHGKPAWMVDHFFVVFVTLLAAFGILLVIRSWTFPRHGEWAWIGIAGIAVVGALLLRAVGA